MHAWLVHCHGTAEALGRNGCLCDCHSCEGLFTDCILPYMTVLHMTVLQEVGPEQAEVDTLATLERLQYENSQVGD